MFSLFQREPFHALYSMDETVNPTTGMVAISTHENEHHTQSVSDDGPSAELGGILQGSAYAQHADTYINCYLQDTPHFNRISSPDASNTFQQKHYREMDELHGLNNHTTVIGPVHLNSVASMAVGHNPGTELQNVSRMLTQTSHSCSTTMPCEWLGVGNAGICGVQIKCTSISEHFRNSHRIRKSGDGTPVSCRWRGCGKRVKGRNFVRHIRECHLSHSRGKKYP
ncbi:hypothetical protein J3R82DRAFT_9367 [Butyriboletus roseoflavus]|nr:hypothetical protein J3R82DRAFT_9367 [Butyriboletus roseoflavus]